LSGWEGLVNLAPHKFRCGHCAENVCSEKGYFRKGPGDRIYICPNCSLPSLFSYHVQIPGPIIGNKINNVPADIEALYMEARQAYSVNAFTASVMVCRKLLMHIAVQKGAKAGQTFHQYVDYLGQNHFVPPDGMGWVDHIRDKGNDANHEIVIMKKEDAEDLITFIEMLLKFIYEFPAKIKAKTKPTP